MAESRRRVRRPKPNAKATAKAKANANAKPKAKPKQAKPPRTARRRRAVVRTSLFLVALVGGLFAFVYPTRTFLDQRNQTNAARTQLAVLRRENAKLAKQAKELSTDSAIERLARQTYGLVRPGETPFVILPAPTTTTALPATNAAKPAP